MQEHIRRVAARVRELREIAGVPHTLRAAGAASARVLAVVL